MKKILFFENSYCQIEILPQENYDDCIQQANISQAFGKAHLQGLGYSDALARPIPPCSIGKLKLSECALSECLLATQMTRQDVYTEYDNFVEPCENMFAYASGGNIILFFEKDADIITKIWLILDVKSKEDYQVAKEMFSAISSLGDLILADWGWHVVEPLNHADSILQYLDKRLKAFCERCIMEEHKHEKAHLYLLKCLKRWWKQVNGKI